jgi:hypothetical protein
VTEWLSLHVFYSANLTRMLVECVAPLVRDLRSAGLIERYFFIRYWFEGPHLRLRLLPAAGTDPDEITGRADAAVGEFLRRRPALHDPHYPGADEHYRALGLAEYGQRWWTDRYGGSGTMPLRPTNTAAYVPYEPEYDRYGGPDGVTLAEWHFEHSSDQVLRLSATTNVHVRPTLLGLGLQQSLAMCLAFLRSPEEVVLFVRRYRAFWQHAYDNRPAPADAFDDAFARGAGPLRERVAVVRASSESPRLPGDDFPGAWIRHCRDLRTRVDALRGAGRIALAGRDGGPPPSDPASVSMLLLSSYLHMTNNRLGLAINDEIYISYLIERALSEPE